MPSSRRPNQRSRNVDSESTKPRVSNKRSGSSSRKVDRERQEQSDSEISDVENALDLSDLDDSTKPIIKEQKNKSSKATPRSAAIRPSNEKASDREHYKDDSNANDFLGNDSLPSMFIIAAAIHLPTNAISFSNISTFTPNCWTMFNTLHSMHVSVSENSYMYRILPSYCTITSRLYYSVLWFIQVLRAKSACGSIRALESSFLRSFEKLYPFESLPIAGPLVSYFQGLGAYHSDDPMYTWIAPDIPEMLGPNADSQLLKQPKSLLYPSVPGIISLLEAIRSSANIAASVNARQEFIPFDNAVGGIFAGRTVAANAVANSNSWQETLDLPGINMAPEQLVSTLAQAQPSLARSLNLPTINANTDLSNIRNFLMMNEMYWFRPVMTNAAEEATFFKGATTLANIPTTTGNQILFVGKSEVPSTVSPRPTDWYPGLRVSDLATFTTTRGKSTEADLAIGIVNQVIRDVPDEIAGHGPLGTVASNDLTGQYWQNNVIQYETPIAVSAQGHVPHVIQLHYYVPKGKQSV